MHLAQSSKIQGKFVGTFRIELPIELSLCKYMENRIELILGANPISRPLYCMILKEENKVRKVVDEYLDEGVIYLI